MSYISNNAHLIIGFDALQSTTNTNVLLSSMSFIAPSVNNGFFTSAYGSKCFLKCEFCSSKLDPFFNNFLTLLAGIFCFNGSLSYLGAF